MRIILITGDTYPHRRALRTVGAQWSPALGGWIISAEAEPSVRAVAEPAGLTLAFLDEGAGTVAPASYADRRAAQAERHERRAAKLEARADSRERRRGTEEAALGRDPMYTDYSFFTEPIKIGHHSEGRHRRAREKMAARMDKVVVLWREEAELRGRAQAAAEAAKPDAERGVAFMQRRIDELSSELRKVERNLAGSEQGDWRTKAEEHRAFVAQGIAYWNALIEQTGGIQHSKDTVKRGDTVVRMNGLSGTVERVNAKTVTLVYPVTGFRGTVPYAEIVEVIGGAA